jgi:hypothetical protein
MDEREASEVEERRGGGEAGHGHVSSLPEEGAMRLERERSGPHGSAPEEGAAGVQSEGFGPFGSAPEEGATSLASE